jgi:thiamine pyrophosphokinase
MDGLVFTGGEGPDAEFCASLAAGLIAGGGLVAAADSGLALAEKAGVRPDWIVGDMDSLDDPSRLEKYQTGRVLRFPAGKDFTDTELALDLLWDKGCGDITVAGGGGGRLDHTLAMAALFERERAPCRWFTAREKVFLVTSGFFCAAKKAAAISVFPLGDGPWKARSSGLRWPLDDVTWRRGFFGISNAAETGDVEIQSLSGRFLIVMPE